MNSRQLAVHGSKTGAAVTGLAHCQVPSNQSEIAQPCFLTIFAVSNDLSVCHQDDLHSYRKGLAYIRENAK